MAKLAYASWVHGNSMQIQWPEKMDHVEHVGGGFVVEANKSTNNWFHFPIPTPVIVDDNRLRIGSVMLSFETKSTDAIVRHIHIYDGGKRIAEHNNVNLTGQFAFKRFDVPGHPDVQWGVGISLGVEFGGDPKSHRMDFWSVGVDFLP